MVDPTSMGYSTVVLRSLPQLHKLIVSGNFDVKFLFHILTVFFLIIFICSKCSEDDTVRLAVIFMEIINEGFDLKQWKAYLAEYIDADF